MRLVPMLLLLASCTTREVVYVYPDASLDSGHDAGRDSGTTYVLDMGTDTGVDTGPACECTSGPCCDGCAFRPATYQCVSNGPVSAACTMGAGLPPTCTGKTRITYTYGDRWCSGTSAECRGRIDTSNATPSSVNDACTYDANLYNVVVCRADTSELGASCASWCGP